MKLFSLLIVLVTEVFCGDRRVSPAEASMGRIMTSGYSNGDPDVQWLMKQADLMLVVVSNGDWQASMEERQKLIQVIERFVTTAIEQSSGVDIRDAAEILQRVRLEYVRIFMYAPYWSRVPSFNLKPLPSQFDWRSTSDRDLSRFGMFLAVVLQSHTEGLPRMLSDPDFPLTEDRRVVLASLTSIRARFYLNQSRDYLDVRGREFISNYMAVESREYWEMVVDVYSKVEARYNWLCQQTGVDVAATYRPIHLLRSLTWGSNVAKDQQLLRAVVPMIDDAQEIELAKKVGLCLDFALRHHFFGSFSKSLQLLGNHLAQSSGIGPDATCHQLMTEGFKWLQPNRPPLASRVVPTPVVDDGSLLTDFADANPPVPMENTDPGTIRVMRLVEIVALRVPEIRHIFQSIDEPASMSKFERILLNALDREDVRIDRLAYDLVRFLKMPILHLPMMRERYLSSLSPEQFEGLRRIISCMTHLEPVVGARYKAIDYVEYAREHHGDIDLISRGLEALTRLFKKFQADPIRSDTYSAVARYRTMTGFLPAYIVFGCCFGLVTINIDKFRQSLEWVISHESEFVSPVQSVHEVVSGKGFQLGDPINIVGEFLGGRFPEFDRMVFAVDRILRHPRAGFLHLLPTGLAIRRSLDAPDTLSVLASTLPIRIFATTMQLGGMEAIEEQLRTQLLRIVPLSIKAITSIINGQNPPGMVPTLYVIHDMLEDLKPTDEGKLRHRLNELESRIPSPQENPTLGPL